MTRKEVYNMIASIGVPSAYHHFSKATAKAPPFICFYYPNDNDFRADNSNYVRVDQLIIELYTDNKDFALEGTVESVLAQNDVVFSKEETYIDSEQMYMVIYTTEVIIHA